MRRIHDWIFTVPVLIAFGGCLVVFDVAGRLVRPFGLRGFEYVMAALQRSLVAVFRLAGTRIDVRRHPDVLPKTGYAVISNHQSMFDIMLIGGYLFSNFPKYVAKKELSKWIPSVSLNLRRGGNALIDRANRIDSVRAIRDMAAEAQRRGVSAVIFPEGTRSRRGEIQPFKPAGSRAMLEAANQLPVVPVTIDGSWKLFENNLFPVPFGSRVRLEFGAPIERRPGDAESVVLRAEQVISSTLAEWRSSS